MVSSLAAGLVGAGDGAVVVVGTGSVDGLIGADGLAVALGVVTGLAVALGVEELLVGAGEGGPKQPESAKRAQTPRMLNVESLRVVMMPPWVWAPDKQDSTCKVRRSRPPEQGLKSDIDAGPVLAVGRTRQDAAGPVHHRDGHVPTDPMPGPMR